MNLRDNNPFNNTYNSKRHSIKQLPTYNSIYKHYLHELNSNKHIAAVHNTADFLSTLWMRASLPTIQIKSINNKLNRLIKIFNNLKKSCNSKQYHRYVDNRFNKYNILFDICACKCDLPRLCSCEEEQRVTPVEVEFLLDQRTTRNLYI